MAEEVGRRDYLKYLATIIGGLVIGAIAGYVAKPAAPAEVITETVEKTVTKTVTVTPVPTPTPIPRLIRVAFSPNNLGSPYWRTCLAGAEKAVADINKHVGREVLVMDSAEYLDDAAKQADHIDSIIGAPGKYQFYVAPAVVEDPTVEPLRKLKEAGIPCILYDRDTAPAGRKYRLFCTITDNVDAGALEMKRLQEALEASGKPTPWKIAACWGHPGASSCEDRRTGSKMVLDELVAAGKAELVRDQYHEGWSREKARAFVESVLAITTLDAVVCSNDDMALGSVAAVEGAGLTPGKDVFIAGVDAIDEAREAVKAGKLVVTLAQANYAMAYWGILAGFAHLTMGWTSPMDVIPAPLTPVTKENVDVFTLEDPKVDEWATYGPTVEDLPTG